MILKGKVLATGRSCAMYEVFTVLPVLQQS